MNEMRLELDDLDRDAIHKAIARRRLLRIMPDGEGNMIGRTIAEICRGWMGFMNETLATDYLDGIGEQ